MARTAQKEIPPGVEPNGVLSLMVLVGCSLMMRESIKRNCMHRSTFSIDNLKSPSLPLIRVQGILGAKLLDGFHGRNHGCLETGCLDALLVAHHDIAIGEIEVVACCHRQTWRGYIRRTGRWVGPVRVFSERL